MQQSGHWHSSCCYCHNRQLLFDWFGGGHFTAICANPLMDGLVAALCKNRKCHLEANTQGGKHTHAAAVTNKLLLLLLMSLLFSCMLLLFMLLLLLLLLLCFCCCYCCCCSCCCCCCCCGRSCCWLSLLLVLLLLVITENNGAHCAFVSKNEPT